jgi:DIM1 family U5 snRNP protein
MVLDGLLFGQFLGDFKCLHDCSFVVSFYAQVDIDEVQDFTNMYELYDDCTTMFFYRNKHVMVDLGTGNNNKINWASADKGELIDIIEMVYRGARKGRGLVILPKDYSTKYRY